MGRSDQLSLARLNELPYSIIAENMDGSPVHVNFIRASPYREYSVLNYSDEYSFAHKRLLDHGEAVCFVIQFLQAFWQGAEKLVFEQLRKNLKMSIG